MKSQAVIGIGFGDEGKGKVVSHLCSQSPDSLVVRYSGGQQAGHHVVLRDGRDHVFSNFGCGTLHGNDTYWSQYCTVDPIGILNELDVLMEKGIVPTLFINKDCPITTPYEKVHNKKVDKLSGHGSCGVGVGQTIQRQEDHFSIKVRDLFYPSILRIKLQLLSSYYSFTVTGIDDFLCACNELTQATPIVCVDNIPMEYDSIIFEGSQGLLLDQDIGFFPHVTRGNTGTENITKMGFSPDIFLVTRAYQTRHGNGPMTNENLPFNISLNPYEQNFDHTFQGKFRCTLLDLDLLKYAIDNDIGLRNKNKISLVITCMDLIANNYCLTEDSKIFTFSTEHKFVDKIINSLKIESVYLSHDPFPTLEKYE